MSQKQYSSSSTVQRRIKEHAEILKRNKGLYRFLSDLFGEEEISVFLSSTHKKLLPTVRINTLKTEEEETKRRLSAQGFKLVKIEGIQSAYRVVFSPFPIGKTLEHFLGYIYIQDLASMIPSIVLDPRPGEWILDITAAPGSKTTQMAQLMRNTGLIIANDVDITRLKALSHNLDRMGVVNTIITNVDGYKLGFWYPGTFDRVLLDAPCSAIGTIHRTYEILRWWSWAKVSRLVQTQKGLILGAYRALKPGGKLVYSTCTLVPEENEGVVTYLLGRNPEARILQVKLKGLKTRHGLIEWKERCYPTQVKYTLRIYPQDNLTEGFYIALIEKPK